MEDGDIGVKIEKGTRFVPASKRPAGHKDGAHLHTLTSPTIWSAAQEPKADRPTFGTVIHKERKAQPNIGQTPEPLRLPDIDSQTTFETKPQPEINSQENQ